MAITLETKPGTKPRTNKLETKLGTNLAASAWTQDTATRVPHASITKLAHLGLGGLGGLGGAGVLVGWTGQRSATEHKSLQILVRKPVARLRPKNHFATLPMMASVGRLRAKGPPRRPGALGIRWGAGSLRTDRRRRVRSGNAECTADSAGTRRARPRGTQRGFQTRAQRNGV